MPRVFRRKRRRRDVVAPAPDFHLRLAMLRGCFGLVQPLEPAVMPLIEAPRFVNWDPEQVHFVHCDPQRPDGALQYRRMRDVELETFGRHETASFARFRASLFGEIDVGPAGETIFFVPDTFAVTEQDE